MWTDDSPKEIYGWQLSAQKDAQQHSSLEKYKKLQWDITTYLLEWLKSK